MSEKIVPRCRQGTAGECNQPALRYQTVDQWQRSESYAVAAEAGFNHQGGIVKYPLFHRLESCHPGLGAPVLPSILAPLMKYTVLSHKVRLLFDAAGPKQGWAGNRCLPDRHQFYTFIAVRDSGAPDDRNIHFPQELRPVLSHIDQPELDPRVCPSEPVDPGEQPMRAEKWRGGYRDGSRQFAILLVGREAGKVSKSALGHGKGLMPATCQD